MASQSIYPKSTGLVGELSEPWRLEADLGQEAQAYLDLAATGLRAVDPAVLIVADACTLYASILCDAVAINVCVVTTRLFMEGSNHVQ